MIKPQISNGYLSVGLEAIREAENIILKYFNQKIDVNLKKDKSLVTIADKEIEEKIKQIISNYFPNHGFLGEESGHQHPNAEYVWVIDPIDGTKNFVRGLPFFSTLLALVKNSEVIMGISNMTQFKQLAYAVKGKGSFINDKKAKVSTISELNETYLSLGSNKKFEEKHLTTNLMNLSQAVRHQKAWGDCWHFHLVAQGKIDAVVEAKGAIWDIAAPGIIIKEAGGTITDLYGQPFTLNSQSIIASNGLIHQQIVDYFI